MGYLMTPIVWLFRGYECKALAKQEEKNLLWGTYGKGVAEAYERGEIARQDMSLTWKRLDNCDTEHLMAILKKETWICEQYVKAISNILVDRGISRRRVENLVKEVHPAVRRKSLQTLS